MLEKLQRTLGIRQETVTPKKKPSEDEYTIYAKEVEKTLSLLESNLHISDDPEEIAMMTLKTACDFYQGDWAGILEVDMELNLWSPFWWYNPSPEDKTAVLMGEFESSEFLYRWVDAMRENHAMFIEDAEAIKDIYPAEYDIYQRLYLKSAIAVPVKPRPTGFLVVRNPKRYTKRSSMLQMLAFVVLSMVNEKKLMDSAKMVLSPEAIDNDKDIIINLFGSLEIYTAKGVIKEDDLKSPKICRLIAYMILNRRKTHPPLEITNALWPEDESTPEALVNNLRGIIYRFRQAFSLISDYQLIESTPNGYRLNPEFHIMTDLQMFDKSWEAVQNSTGMTRKVEYLRQALAIYRGPVFESACTEHWLMNTATHYSLRYIGIGNELLSKLAELKDYSGVVQYATQILNITPDNMKAYYWKIYAMYCSGEYEIARAELEMAKIHLIEEEYKELVEHLKTMKEKPFGTFIDSDKEDIISI